MGLQAQFEKFNKKIKLSDGDLEDLRSKRDVLLGKLRDSGSLPAFDEYSQGSYAMYLGVNPTGDREFDVDVALRFHSDKEETDPFEYKQAICDVLKHHTDYGATIKKPCVTVTYKKDGEAAYHVDLVSYVYDDHHDTDSQMYIAKGENSEESTWEKADLVKLVDHINNAVEEGEEREQFRRVVRYLKRWKMLRFASGGHVEPPSIGITLIAADSFAFHKGDDLQAVTDVCRAIKDQFFFADYDENGDALYDIKLGLPAHLRFEPDSDVFEKMSLHQKTGFKKKVDKLVKDLDAVASEADWVVQCRRLSEIFGDDFDVPGKSETSKKQPTFIPTTSSSG